MGNVYCSRCSFVGSACDFINKSGRKCKTCEKCRELSRKKDEKRRDCKERAEWQKKYRKMDRNIAKRKESQAEYYRKNKEAILRRNKKYHDENSVARARYLSNWRKNNRDKVREYHHKRRAREAGGDLASCQIKELFERHPYCEYCGSKENLSIDHIVPISRNGKNSLSNVTVACKSCNSSKGNKLLSERRA